MQEIWSEMKKQWIKFGEEFSPEINKGATENDGGDHLCIDMIPSQKGNKGQIITFWHDWNKRSIEGSSLTDYLNKYISNIENGILIYDDEYGVSERI